MEREGGQAIGAMGTRRMQLDLHHDYQVRFHHDEGTRGEGPKEDSQCSRLSATRLIHYDHHKMEDDYSIHKSIRNLKSKRAQSDSSTRETIEKCIVDNPTLVEKCPSELSRCKGQRMCKAN